MIVSSSNATPPSRLFAIVAIATGYSAYIVHLCGLAQPLHLPFMLVTGCIASYILVCMVMATYIHIPRLEAWWSLVIVPCVVPLTLPVNVMNPLFILLLVWLSGLVTIPLYSAARLSLHHFIEYNAIIIGLALGAAIAFGLHYIVSLHYITTQHAMLACLLMLAAAMVALAKHSTMVPWSALGKSFLYTFTVLALLRFLTRFIYQGPLFVLSLWICCYIAFATWVATRYYRHALPLILSLLALCLLSVLVPIPHQFSDRIASFFNLVFLILMTAMVTLWQLRTRTLKSTFIHDIPFEVLEHPTRSSRILTAGGTTLAAAHHHRASEAAKATSLYVKQLLSWLQPTESQCPAPIAVLGHSASIWRHLLTNNADNAYIEPSAQIKPMVDLVLGNSAVSTSIEDPRHYLERAPIAKFRAIIWEARPQHVDLPPAYTFEAFEILTSRLKEDGMIIFHLPVLEVAQLQQISKITHALSLQALMATPTKGEVQNNTKKLMGLSVSSVSTSTLHSWVRHSIASLKHSFFGVPMLIFGDEGIWVIAAPRTSNACEYFASLAVWHPLPFHPHAALLRDRDFIKKIN
jgi:hypothetical protein